MKRFITLFISMSIFLVNYTYSDDIETFIQIGSDLVYEKILNKEIKGTISFRNNFQHGRLQERAESGDFAITNIRSNIVESFNGTDYRNDLDYQLTFSASTDKNTFSDFENLHENSYSIKRFVTSNNIATFNNRTDRVVSLNPHWSIEDNVNNFFTNLRSREESIIMWFLLPFASETRMSFLGHVGFASSNMLTSELESTDELVTIRYYINLGSKRNLLLQAIMSATDPSIYHEIKYYTRDGKLSKLIQASYDSGNNLKVIHSYEFIEGIDDTDSLYVIQSECDRTYTVSITSIDSIEEFSASHFDYEQNINPTDYISDERIELFYRANAVEEAKSFSEFSGIE